MSTGMDETRERNGSDNGSPELAPRAAGGEIDFGGNEPTFDFWGMLWRGKWFILLAVTIGAGIQFQNFREATPIYSSRASVLIKRPANPIPGEPLEKDEHIRHQLETQTHLIKSPR